MFLGGLNNGENVKECVRSLIRPECAGVLHLDFDLSDSPLTGIVVGWYDGILQKVEGEVGAVAVGHGHQIRYDGPSSRHG